ncbi:dimethylarginine dimethylaminohydrolase family protein [Porphyromonas pogonae]|uniref:dimethylarginine dimethylaminohydrolase family protein n=1 Tax=Porphyromonas pogonae TaxID=867595 RepID=UPI002E76B821|nr:arginine deiminase family protein [Porphyromonas pogonae]
MRKITPHVLNETAKLKTVVLGLPESLGEVPTLDQTYDAKSYESVQKGIFPKEIDVIAEMKAFLSVLEDNHVQVLRPEHLDNYNQVFARDVSFVIDDTLFVSNLIPDRELETGAFKNIFESVADGHLERLPEKVHTEGGDVILYNDILFVGCYMGKDYPSFKTARTNCYAIDFFKERFGKKTIVPIELRKDDHNPYKSVLHLDCAFQPVNTDKALFYREGLLNKKDVGVIEDIFGKENIFDVTPEEAYYMNTNIFSISPEIVVSEKQFVRMNKFLSEVWGIKVHAIPYREISKMGGLLRCSTMPLERY